MNTVKELLERADISQKAFAIEIGVSQPTVSDWMHNKKDPRGENLKKVAEYFNVSTHVVKGLDPIPKQEQRQETQPAEIGDIDFALSGEIRDLSDDEKLDILDYVKFKKAQKARQ